MEILVVDDDPSVRTVLEVVLRGEGYEVRSVEDGPGALAAAREKPPGLVVLDLRMPGMDGEEVLAELRKLDPALPVFFLTACGDFPDRPVLDKADCCFVKSSDLSPLVDTIAYVCRLGGEVRCGSPPGLADRGTCWRGEASPGGSPCRGARRGAGAA